MNIHNLLPYVFKDIIFGMMIDLRIALRERAQQNRTIEDKQISELK